MAIPRPRPDPRKGQIDQLEHALPSSAELEVQSTPSEASPAGPTDLGASPPTAGGPPPAVALPFPCAVPDYVQADWLLANPLPPPSSGGGKRNRGRRRTGGGLHWAVHQAVIVQKCARVVLADVVLAQVLWGDR